MQDEGVNTLKELLPAFSRSLGTRGAVAHSKTEAVCCVSRRDSAMPDLFYCSCGFLTISIAIAR